MDVLEDMSSSQDGQLNLASEVARETTAKLISSTLKSKGSYIVFTDSEIEEQEARATWVCEICGENTFEVDYDYVVVALTTWDVSLQKVFKKSLRIDEKKILHRKNTKIKFLVVILE